MTQSMRKMLDFQHAGNAAETAERVNPSDPQLQAPSFPSLAVQVVTRAGRCERATDIPPRLREIIAQGLLAKRRIIQILSCSEPPASIGQRAVDRICGRLRLIVHGFLTVREMKSGEPQFVFELSRQRDSLSLGELEGEVEKLQRQFAE